MTPPHIPPRAGQKWRHADGSTRTIARALVRPRSGTYIVYWEGQAKNEWVAVEPSASDLPWPPPNAYLVFEDTPYAPTCGVR